MYRCTLLYSEWPVPEKWPIYRILARTPTIRIVKHQKLGSWLPKYGQYIEFPTYWSLIKRSSSVSATVIDCSSQPSGLKATMQGFQSPAQRTTVQNVVKSFLGTFSYVCMFVLYNWITFWATWPIHRLDFSELVSFQQYTSGLKALLQYRTGFYGVVTS